jgi:alkanesulfonate monooxygenase SsuD/methylene tetrahydromethanopterin reductase-like flavin-dependent oxidoreductase (luciferase family)
VVRRAEELGFESAWGGEHVVKAATTSRRLFDTDPDALITELESFARNVIDRM